VSALLLKADLDEEVINEMDEYEIVEAFWGEELYWDFAEVKEGQKQLLSFSIAK
jgi:hypothetical protein